MLGDDDQSKNEPYFPMLKPSAFNRRALLGAGLATTPLLAAGTASAAQSHSAKSVPPVTPPPRAAPAVAPDATTVSAATFGVAPSADRDQTAALQAAIDQATAKNLTLALAPGTYLFGGLVLRSGTRLTGAHDATVLRYAGTGAGITAERAANVHIESIRIDGGNLPLASARAIALLQMTDCRRLTLDGVEIVAAGAHGLHLARSSGRIARTRIDGVRDAGIYSLDADVSDGGLVIADTTVTDCRDNGILIWRSTLGDDGTRLSNLAIARVGNRSGGSGEYGNGINVYRAANVAVADCRITDCAYSAIRGNAASNIQMLGNHVARIGEVALYAEFGFEGAMISANVIDGAATGIAVANFNEGGRLAVVEGNLIRNLVRREHEPVDKRGDGIAVEADAVVAGNVIESAATAGLRIGWGPFLRNVVAQGNMIRNATIGIAVSSDNAAGRCLLANNMISGATNGAIRAMDHASAIGADLVTSAPPKHIALNGNVVA